ncbi:MFS transporter [Bifidobacterium myosotis]|nr:MFS transporter [Bifidobacterium myosotis]
MTGMHGMNGENETTTGRTKPAAPTLTAPTPALLAALIFLVALNLRPAIAAVGPVLVRIGSDLAWGEGTLGMLGAMPLWAFAAVSPLVRFVTARIGANRTILMALLVLSIGCVVRSFCGPAGVWLGTLAVGAGIAAGNVLVPVVAKRDYEKHLPLAVGAYSACITAGSAIAGLTSASLADWLGGWRGALAAWAVPAVVVAGLWTVRVIRDRTDIEGADHTTEHTTEFTAEHATDAISEQPARTRPQIEVGVHQDTPQHTGHDTEAAIHVSHPSEGTPLWRRPMTWWVTMFMGLQSAAFYTMCNWLPAVASAAGFDDAAAGVHLFVFQSLGILSGLLIPALMRVHGDQRCAALVSSLPMVIAGTGWMLLPHLSLLWSVIGGMGQGAALVVALTLISLRGSTPAETVALSGIAQSIGYLLASVGPLAFGALAELTGGRWTAPLILFTTLAVAQCGIALLAGRDA